MKLIRQLITIVGILAVPAVKAAEPLPVVPTASPVTEEFSLNYPKKTHLTAQQLYQMGYPAAATAIDKNIGQFVLLDVVVVIERDVPLVDIEIPKELEPPQHAIKAHLVAVTTLASSLKKGQRLRIEGIIVDEGYGAYMIYVHRVQRIKAPV